MLRSCSLPIAIVAALGSSTASEAVSLNPDGLGQALIFPYYTVRSVNGNAFNTFVSVVNHTGDAKAIRVRFLEGRNARAALSFNLYLSPNDVWTGAIIPQGPDGARVITTDTSCTNVAFDNAVPSGLTFQNTQFIDSAADGFGTGLDRTREGYVEMIEMATLTGATAAAVTHSGTGVPANCGAIASETAVLAGPPTGKLSGTLTLINVQNGSDFTVNAEALSELSTQPFFRPSADPYPGFDAAEVTPASVFVDNGKIYRSAWSRGVDAVSAVLMRTRALGEFVLDPNTRSRTDIVVTFPTRKHYVPVNVGTRPFAASGNDEFGFAMFNRDERGQAAPGTDPSPPGNLMPAMNGAVNVVTMSVGATTVGQGALGSQRFQYYAPPTPYLPGSSIFTLFENGMFILTPTPTAPSTTHALTNLPSSSRIDIATGQVTTGSDTLYGMPMVGFVVRTFENGTLACGAGSCQGNYGGAFPLKYRRQVTP